MIHGDDFFFNAMFLFCRLVICRQFKLVYQIYILGFFLLVHQSLSNFDGVAYTINDENFKTNHHRKISLFVCIHIYIHMGALPLLRAKKKIETKSL